MKFVKFSDMEERVQEHIAKKFPGIKDSDLIYCENTEKHKKDLWEKLYDFYIVENIEDDGVDIACAWHGDRESFGMDERVEKALENAPEGFTIYGKKPAAEEAEAEEPEAEEPAADDWEEVEITRKCGHKETIRINGSTWDKVIQIKEELKKRPLCKKCWKKQQREASKKAATWAKEEGLPELKGSARQVKWAEKIREEKLYKLDWQHGGSVDAYKFYAGIESAAVWIELRFIDCEELKRDMEHIKRRFRRLL